MALLWIVCQMFGEDDSDVRPNERRHPANSILVGKIDISGSLPQGNVAKVAGVRGLLERPAERY